MTELNTLEEAKEVLKGIEEKKVIEILNSTTKTWSSCNNVQQYNNLPNFAVCKYRVKPEHKMIPLDRGDFILGKTIIRLRSINTTNHEMVVIGKSDININICDNRVISYDTLMQLYEYSNDNGVTFKRCEKEGV